MKELLAWFDVHFHPSSFHGRIQLGYRKKNSTALLPLITNETKMVRDFIKDMYFRSDYDYYITANAVSGVKRRAEGLFSFHNIVIDLDCHCDFPEGSSGIGGNDGLQRLLEEFLWRFRRDKPESMPFPTSIVRTGRGIQLWWALVPLHAKCKPYYDEVREGFMNVIQQILCEYSGKFILSEDLSVLSLDSSASSNDVGYYRLPGTVNTKVGRMVEVDVSKEIFVLQDLVKSVKSWNKVDPVILDQKLIRDFGQNEVFLLKNIETLAFFRVRQLILLRKIRNKDIHLETRNNLNFMMYNALLPALGEEESWNRLLRFNEEFKEPMSMEELEGVIISARDKGGYRYTNEKMITFLEVTPEEQENIGLFDGKNQKVVRFSKKPSRDASRALQKSVRDDLIKKLALEGKSVSEIGETAQVSLPTVRKVLGQNQEKKKAKEAAISMLEQGNSTKEVAKISGLSIRTIQRICTQREQISV